MSDTFCGDVRNYSHLKPGMFVEVIDHHIIASELPPIGSICKITRTYRGRLVINARAQTGHVLSGNSMEYRVVPSIVKLKGVAKFLKEKQL